jgi:hypothetical protein
VTVPRTRCAAQLPGVRTRRVTTPPADGPSSTPRLLPRVLPSTLESGPLVHLMAVRFLPGRGVIDRGPSGGHPDDNEEHHAATCARGTAAADTPQSPAPAQRTNAGCRFSWSDPGPSGKWIHRMSSMAKTQSGGEPGCADCGAGGGRRWVTHDTRFGRCEARGEAAAEPD